MFFILPEVIPSNLANYFFLINKFLFYRFKLSLLLFTLFMVSIEKNKQQKTGKNEKYDLF